MKIPFVDLTRQPETLRRTIEKRIRKVVKGGDFILGEHVEMFERDFAAYNGAKHCIGVGSGTDAMLLSLLALGVTEGDEVIVPAFTFSGTVSPIVLIGATPVLVDSLPSTPYIDPKKVKKALTKRTKAIVPVHLYGGMCAMDEIMNMAKKSGIPVIEDACQAHGSVYKGKKAGSMGDLGIFSFYPSKNLGAYGDAGAVITDRSELADAIRSLRDHGQKSKYVHTQVGTNSRLDAIQAVVLSAKLPYLDRWNKKRRSIIDTYKIKLDGLPVRFIPSGDETTTNAHLFIILTEKRDELKKYLESKNVQCGIHYPYPIHLNEAYRSLGYKKGDFPNAEKLAAECLSLPLFPEMEEGEVAYVANAMRSFFS